MRSMRQSSALMEGIGYVAKRENNDDPQGRMKVNKTDEFYSFYLEFKVNRNVIQVGHT